VPHVVEQFLLTETDVGTHPEYHSPGVPQSRSTTVPEYHGPGVPRSRSTTVPEYHGALGHRPVGGRAVAGPVGRAPMGGGRCRGVRRRQGRGGTPCRTPPTLGSWWRMIARKIAS
jgi:hypothetical protein